MSGDNEDQGANRNPNPPEEVGTQSAGPMKPTGKDDGYTDGRERWEWRSKYPKEACNEMRLEAWVLIVMLLVALMGAGLFLGAANQEIKFVLVGLEMEFRCMQLAIFFVGWLGSVTFSIKWLVHSVAKGKWHLDRRYWRLLVPMIGGVYACVVLALLGAGYLGSGSDVSMSSISSAAALAFLVGYFSDGVSGLLSNVANAVFGTLEKK